MARREWQRRRGRCPVCKKRQWLIGHHLVYRQHVVRLGGDVWDFRNCLFVGQGCLCHAWHHNGQRRIPIGLVHKRAWEFAVELFGSKAKAEVYFERYYAPERAPTLPKRRSQSDQALSPREAQRYRRVEGRASGS